MNINQLNTLFHLADKYLVEEIKGSIIDQTENWFTSDQAKNLKNKKRCSCIVSVIDDIKTDPIKDAVTKGILKFLGQRSTAENPAGGAVQHVDDVVDMAEAYSSGKYEESIMEGMVKAVVISLIDPQWTDGGEEWKRSIIQDTAEGFENMPETAACCKFMFKVMQMLSKMGEEEQPTSWGAV